MTLHRPLGAALSAAALAAFSAAPALAGSDPIATALASKALSQAYQNQVARTAGGPTIAIIGDSRTMQSTNSYPPGTPNVGSQYITGGSGNSIQQWLAAILGERAVFDWTGMGYPGSPGGLSRLHVLTGGTCPASTAMTVSSNTPSGGVAAGNFTLTSNASGQVPVGTFVNFNVTSASGGVNGGSGYTSIPTFTFSPSCTTQPTFSYVLSGVGNYGVPGDTTAGMLDRVTQDLCVTRPDFAVNLIGINDLTGGVAAATVLANSKAIIAAEQACGIRVVWVSNLGRGSSITTSQDQSRQWINRQIYQLARASRSSSQVPPIIYVDAEHLWQDPDNSVCCSNPRSGITYDSVHPSTPGAFLVAMTIANAIAPYLPPATFLPNSQQDVYNATYNPAGNLLPVNTALFQAGGGGAGSNSSGSGTCGGTIGYGWSFSYSGTATVTCTSSIEATASRTDGGIGSRQVITYSGTSATTDINGIGFGEYNSITSNLTQGTDSIYAEADIDLSNLQGVTYLGMNLVESGGGVTTNQGNCLVSSNANGSTYPQMPTSTYLAKLPDAGVLLDYGKTAAGSFRLHCKTPPIKTQAGASSYGVTFYLRGYANPSPLTFTAKIANVAVRKSGV